MNQQAYRITLALALLALISALSAPGIFLWPLNAFRLQNYYGEGVLIVAFVDTLRVLFLLVPVASFIGAIRKKRWTFYGLMVFPVIAEVFGAAAIPLISHAFPPVTPRTIAITIINLGVVALAAWLCWGTSNNSFQRTREKPRAA